MNRRTGMVNGNLRQVHGFTLLEVLVALSIIAIVFVSVIRLQGQTIAMTESVRFYAVAPFLAQSKMAEVNMDPEAFLGNDAGEFDDEFTQYKWQVAIKEKEVQFEDQAPLTFMEATVTVSLQPDGLTYRLIEFQAQDTDIF